LIREVNSSCGCHALHRLRTTAGIHDYEEAPLGLEEIYCALFAREASVA
jgi:hypothetical protein